jgi:hypothetical protein
MNHSTTGSLHALPTRTLAAVAVASALAACNGSTVSGPTTPDGGHPGSGAGSSSSAVQASSEGVPQSSGTATGSTGGHGSSVSKGSASSASSSGNPGPPASVYIGSTLGTNPNDLASTMSCPYKSPGDPFLTVGIISAGIPTPVPQGTRIGGNTVDVSCSVAPTASGFAVNVEVSEGQVDGVTLFGILTDTPGPQTGIQVTFTSDVAGIGMSFGSSAAAPCSVTLSPRGVPPITAGRVWGTLTCPMLTDLATQSTCFGSAEFLFQNCTE